jgi:hypothetical protein
MKEKSEERGVEVQGIEMIDFGDVAEETRQWGPIQQVPDTCCSYTYIGE